MQSEACNAQHIQAYVSCVQHCLAVQFSACVSATGVRVTQLKPPSSPRGEALPTSCVADMRMPDGSVDALPVDLVLWSAGASPVTKDAQQRSGLPFPISACGSIQTVRV